MRVQIDKNKLSELESGESFLARNVGEKGSFEREQFNAKAKIWYYAKILKKARKRAGITQNQIAEKMGKHRSYITTLEKGEVDMQLSTFLIWFEALGLEKPFNVK